MAHRLASNGGTQLPIKGIIVSVTQLLASPERSGPGSLNYNQPSSSRGTPPVSILSIMKTADGLIPYEGGTSVVFNGAEEFELMGSIESMLTWAQHNGCDGAFQTSEHTTDTGDGTAIPSMITQMDVRRDQGASFMEEVSVAEISIFLYSLFSEFASSQLPCLLHDLLPVSHAANATARCLGAGWPGAVRLCRWGGVVIARAEENARSAMHGLFLQFHGVCIAIFCSFTSCVSKNY